MKRIAIVDDHPLVRQALATLLAGDPALEVVLQHDGREGAEDEILRARPDLVLLDLSLPGRGGLEVLRELKRRSEAIRVLVISMHEEPAYVSAALKAGASGYVLKANDTALIPQAIRAVLEGRTFVSASLQITEGATELTAREADVVAAVAQGKSAKEIAHDLRISYRTVEVHRLNAMKKLGAKNIADLTRIALEKKLVL